MLFLGNNFLHCSTPSNIYFIPQVAAFLTPRFVVWGARVQAKDGYEASQRFEAAGYPFLGVFVPTADSSATRPKCSRVWMHEGTESAQVRVVVFLRVCLNVCVCMM